MVLRKLVLFSIVIITLQAHAEPFFTDGVQTFDLAKVPKELLPLQTIKRFDPNSKKMFTYKGYYLKALINHFFKRKKFEYLETFATDGYRVTLKKDHLDIRENFVALEIVERKDGFFKNSIVNKRVKYKPSYLLVGKDSEINTPYAVETYHFYKKEIPNPILTKAPSHLLAGAKVFVNRCTKCHHYDGYGGQKAPEIVKAVKKWPKDDELIQFLKRPKATINKKTHVFGYKGKDQDLVELIKFLRTLK